MPEDSDDTEIWGPALSNPVIVKMGKWGLREGKGLFPVSGRAGTSPSSHLSFLSLLVALWAK